MRRFAVCCLCVWGCLPAFVAIVHGDESPVRRGYIYLSKGNVPEGTARMSADDLEDPAPRRVAQRVSYESVSELGYEYPASPNSIPTPYAPVYGSPAAGTLRGTRYGYTYAGRRYSAHCLTAPGYEAACEHCPPIGGPCAKYRIECRNPGPLACLFGCHEPYCRVVKVRRPCWHRGICHTRGPVAELPSFLLADIERYELPEDSQWRQEALPPGLSYETVESPSQPAPRPVPSRAEPTPIRPAVPPAPAPGLDLPSEESAEESSNVSPELSIPE